MSVLSTIKLIALICAGVFIFYILTNDPVEVRLKVPQKKLIYILDWRKSLGSHYSYIDQGNTVFKQNYCPFYPNCFLTDDREIFNRLGDYDAILFHGFKLPFLEIFKLPNDRSMKQRYIFATMESANDNPICNPHYDGYFNWTWTYRLDSDLVWAYFLVRDLAGNVVAPRLDVTWLPHYQPLSDELRIKLSTKKKAAAWFVSHCKTSSDRESFVKEISRELRRYDLHVDTYGGCSANLQCPKGYWYCNQLIQNNYYFYFAFENSFDKDYVTEKVLNGLNNLAVPVVYGGANYSRFLPPGSYLDGRALGAEQLARTMRDIIHNRSRYEDMFRWRNHYEIKEPFMTDVCELCAKLNDVQEEARVSVYERFREWWNRDSKLCPHWHKD